jgi:hypothetical protein
MLVLPQFGKYTSLNLREWTAALVAESDKPPAAVRERKDGCRAGPFARQLPQHS